MTNLEGVELLREIESKYDVMAIKYKGVSVWPYLKLYLLDSITLNRESKMSKSVVVLVLKCLFLFNPFVIFKRFNIWIFTACERRKRLGDKMVQRVCGGVSTDVERCLMIEKPSLVMGHYKKAEIEEKNIISEAWLLLFTRLIVFLSKPFTPRIENEIVFQNILKDYNLKFNYKHYTRLLNAQRKAMRIMLAIIRKPKMVLMESPYDTMGYIWAFHQKEVKVIELQHGVINKDHEAYNGVSYDKILSPDSICVYGSEEYEYFTETEPQYAEKVYMTGLYMLERADLYFNIDVYSEYRKKYEKIFVVSGQAIFDLQLSGIIDQIAGRNPQYMFVYIPRHVDEKLEFKCNNVDVKGEVNIYEYLKWADVHITVSSTTCLEAHYYHTPTIFVDLENMATTFYRGILSEKNGAVYIQNNEEFEGALELLMNQDIEWKEFFAHHHIERIREAVSE